MVDRDNSIMKNKYGHDGQVAHAIGKSLMLLNNIDSWQNDCTERLIENLKFHSVLVSKLYLFNSMYFFSFASLIKLHISDVFFQSIQGIYDIGSRMSETERRLGEVEKEGASL